MLQCRHGVGSVRFREHSLDLIEHVRAISRELALAVQVHVSLFETANRLRHLILDSMQPLGASKYFVLRFGNESLELVDSRSVPFCRRGDRAPRILELRLELSDSAIVFGVDVARELFQCADSLEARFVLGDALECERKKVAAP